MRSEQLKDSLEMLVCPVTKQTLTRTSAEEALSALGGNVTRLANDGRSERATETMLLRADRQGAYPVVNGMPILMAPEMLVPTIAAKPIDTSIDPYREAYEEMDYYEEVAGKATENLTKTPSYSAVKDAVAGGAFPGPAWINATYDPASQADSYRYIAPVEAQRIVQIGGSGGHAVKFLVAGAAESWLVTPMLAEALYAQALAAAFDVDDRLRCVIAIGEELPFASDTFDRAYSAGSIHHTITTRSFPEIARVLKPGGRFAALEPWRAPFYGIGIKVFGKREVGINCRPMNPERVASMQGSFESSAVVHHGALTRYPLLALYKLGVKTTAATNSRIMAVDDKIASLAASTELGQQRRTPGYKGGLTRHSRGSSVFRRSSNGEQFVTSVACAC